MFFVVRNVHGKPSFAKDDRDPRQMFGYKESRPYILDIVHLTPLGETKSIAELRDMWIEAVFDRPSPYKEAEKPKPPPIAKPPKELMGPRE
jgi:hypothetical protein